MLFIVYGLAVYRLSNMLANESGPFDVFDKLRYILGVRYNDLSEPYWTNTVSHGVICVWCNSIWIGLLVTLAHIFLKQDIVYYTCLPFALSSVAMIVNAYMGEPWRSHNESV